MSQDKYIADRFQLITGLRMKGIKDEKVLEAMMKVPRHDFVDKGFWVDPYEDAPQPIGSGQTISQPYIVALMTQSLKLKGDEKILEIGSGSGYQTAILCELAKHVYSIERIEDLYKKAKNNLSRLGYTNYTLLVADGTEGWRENAPYDAIIVTAKAPAVPEPYKEQLEIDGRLVIPVGKASPQQLIRIIRKKDYFITEHLCDVYFVPLIGKHGWEE